MDALRGRTPEKGDRRWREALGLVTSDRRGRAERGILGIGQHRSGGVADAGTRPGATGGLVTIWGLGGQGRGLWGARGTNRGQGRKGCGGCHGIPLDGRGDGRRG